MHAHLVQDYLYRNEAFFKPWLPAYSPRYFEQDFIEAWMEVQQEELRRGQTLHWYLFHAQDPQQCCILGDITFSHIQRGVFQSCFLGYKIDQKLQGQGYALEALQHSIRFLFEEWKLHRIEANIMPHNSSSIRLIERLGFEREGLSRKLLKINNRWEDHWRYVLLNEKED
jgi:ribosomal-protein-alanine N-acetyltransferase